MNVDATVAQILCIGDGGRRSWAGRCGGNARNCICRLTTDMRTTQGQAAFGHNDQAIITYSYMVKQIYSRYRWTHLFNTRVTHLRSSSTHKSICYELFWFTNYTGKVEPQFQAAPIEFGSPHEAIIRAGFVDICLPILHSYWRPSVLIFDACHAWGGCGWHKHIPRHSKHHRQRDASLTAKLDLAPPPSQSPSHVYNV
jgi:hypothetical protein